MNELEFLLKNTIERIHINDPQLAVTLLNSGTYFEQGKYIDTAVNGYEEISIYNLDLLVHPFYYQSFIPYKQMIEDILHQLIDELNLMELSWCGPLNILNDLRYFESDWRQKLAVNYAELQINNQGNFYNNLGGHEWKGLRFRSYSEKCIAEELERRNILFWPLPACRIDGRTLEVDFLVQHPESLNFGILEVHGQPYHPVERATQDHTRSQYFFERGINVQFYDAEECRNNTVFIVDKFLKVIKGK